MTLYDLTGDWQTVMDMLEDPNADIQAIQDTLESIEGEIEDKADHYAMMIRQLIYDAKAIEAEEKRLFERRQSINNNVRWMKQRLEAAMRITGKTKFKTALFSFGIQANPASIVIDNAAAVPRTFLIPQPPQLDKEALKTWLKENKCDFAHLERTESLRIR